MEDRKLITMEEFYNMLKTTPNIMVGCGDADEDLMRYGHLAIVQDAYGDNFNTEYNKAFRRHLRKQLREEEE